MYLCASSVFGDPLGMETVGRMPTGTFLWEADGHGNSLRRGRAYAIDRPRSDRDVTSFEQRHQLVSLRVIGHYVWMQLFQGGEA